MFSIGELSRKTGVKVPTIRYYEDTGLLNAPDRTSGNQRRYRQPDLDRLGFIKHARDLGFSIQSILALVELHEHPDRNCREATDIAMRHLSEVRRKIARLRALEVELERVAEGCSGDGDAAECYVLTALSDHGLCRTSHAE